MPFQISQPPYRIETPRTVVRCYNPEDAPLLAESVAQSVEHLKPWMPWAHAEPEPLSAKVQRLRHMRAEFDSDRNYVYGIFNPEESFLIGGTGLHPRVGPKAIEIGYWINVNYVNQGYCTEVAGALTRVAFEILHVERVEIHCDPKNIASANIPKKLDFIHEATLRKRVFDEQGRLRDTMVWSLMEENYALSPAKHIVMKAFDATGVQIL